MSLVSNSCMSLQVFFALEFSLFAHVCLHVNVLLAFCVVSVNGEYVSFLMCI